MFGTKQSHVIWLPTSTHETLMLWIYSKPNERNTSCYSHSHSVENRYYNSPWAKESLEAQSSLESCPEQFSELISVWRGCCCRWQVLLQAERGDRRLRDRLRDAVLLRRVCLPHSHPFSLGQTTGLRGSPWLITYSKSQTAWWQLSPCPLSHRMTLTQRVQETSVLGRRHAAAEEPL